MSEFQLQGWEELMKNMDALPGRLQKNIVRGMLRDSANAVRDAVKEKAPVLLPGTKNPHERYAGQLRDSVVSASFNSTGFTAAGVRFRGSREALSATKQAGRALRKGAKGLKAAARAFGNALAVGYYWRWIEFGSPHNEPPRPFIRQAWDGIKGSLVERMAAYARKRLALLARD